MSEEFLLCACILWSLTWGFYVGYHTGRTVEYLESRRD